MYTVLNPSQNDRAVRVESSSKTRPTVVHPGQRKDFRDIQNLGAIQKQAIVKKNGQILGEQSSGDTDEQQEDETDQEQQQEQEESDTSDENNESVDVDELTDKHWSTLTGEIEDGDHDEYLDELKEAESRNSVIESINERMEEL